MKKILLLTLLLGATIFSVAPVVHVVALSLREGNSFASSGGMLFQNATTEHFRNLFTTTPFFLWLRNSILVSASVTALGVSVAAFSGYALSRWAFRGRRWAMLGILVSQMFPCTFFLLPFYLLLAKLHLVDTFLGLTVIYSATALPFCVWQMKGYFDTIPRDLEEAARLDGCSPFGAFWRVVLPVSLPALAITALFNFLTAWSEYMLAAVILQNPSLYTLPLGVKSFQASMGTQWGLFAASAVAVSVPAVLLFLALSRYLISGLTLGGTKG